MLSTGALDVNPDPLAMGQARVSVPVIWSAVNLKSNILGMRPPKFNFRPIDRKDPNLREQAEGIEAIVNKTWHDEDMDQVHLDACRTLGLYGRAILQDGILDGKTYTTNIDQQYNLWISWRRLNEPEAMCFVEMVSEQEAVDMGWDGKTVDAALRFNVPIYGGFSHDDALGLRTQNWISARTFYKKVPVVHFYYNKKKGGNILYGLIVNGQIISEDTSLRRKSWPFKWVEAEHVPGLPWGVGDAEPLLDIQAEICLRNTDWAEAVRRNTKDQWKSWGLKHLNPRVVPGNGRIWELTDKDTDDIEPLKFPIDNVEVQAYIANVWSNYHRVSGIPAEAEGGSIGAGSSGFQMLLKYQSLITALAPRRIRLQKVYRQWAMDKLQAVKQLYPEYADFITKLNFILEVQWSEVTPKDVAQVVQNLVQTTQSKLQSHYSAMEELELIPEDEFAFMEEFNQNPLLDPQGAMATAQAQMMMQQIAQQSQQQPGTGQSQNALTQQAREDALASAPTGGPQDNQHNPLPMGKNTAATAVGPGA